MNRRSHYGNKKILIFVMISLLALTQFSSTTLTGAVNSMQVQVDITTTGQIKNDFITTWLHTEGKWIKDSNNNTIILRGANFAGYEYGAFDSHSEEDYARMADWGFNVVRLPLSWHYIEPEPGIFNETYLTTHLDKDITWAKKFGLYIILDANHQYHWSPHWGGEGIPTWMVSGYPNTEEGKNSAMNDFWLGKGPNGTDPSDINPSMQERFVVLWNYLANRYNNEPTIAAYDLFNEPGEGTLLPFEEKGAYLYPFYQRLIQEVRKVDEKHIIMIEPAAPGWYWHSQYVEEYILGTPNLIFSIHFYRLAPGYSEIGYSPTEQPTLNRYFLGDNPQTDVTKNWSIPVWVGEFGTFTNAINSEAWMKDVVEIFFENDIGWAYWTYGKWKTTETLLDSNGNERTQLTDYLKLNK